MPTLASFNGIKINLYADEHPPPHFHARYAEHVAQIGIQELNVTEGSLPLPQLRLVREWATTRVAQLLGAWAALEAGKMPEAIS